MSSELPFQTDSTLSSCHFTKDDILQIITNQDPNNDHSNDKISICMLKICGDSVCRPLNIICLQISFLWNGKKPILFQFIKKVISKWLKTTIMFLFCQFVVKYLIALENDFISPKQSGFRPGGSCINPLLLISHENLRTFDISLEVQGLLLDVPKAFDKV